MALTGLQIFKVLPKTNCGDCGISTCLAYAMKLASGKAALDDCPHLSDEAKDTLGAGSAPPIRGVTIGTGDQAFEVGKEKVLFRHEETFYNPTKIAVVIDDSLPPGEFSEKLEKISALRFERAGSVLSIDAIALEAKGGRGLARCAAEITGPLPLILISDDPAEMEAALAVTGSTRPLVYGATEHNYEKMTATAKKYGCPMVVRGGTLDEIAGLTGKVKALGLDDLIVDAPSSTLSETVKTQTQIRRMALKKGYRPLGYPTVAWAACDDPSLEMMTLNTHICKYVALSLTRLTEPWQIFPSLTLRQNIFTDPQKPIQVEPRLYQIGTPDSHSPLLVTTNFSLTYFLVSGEIEASKIPSYLLIVDTEGTSVLTAWAADKFNGKIIAEAIRTAGLEELLDHRNIILPGHVAILADSVKEASGWDAVAGPKEASGLPSFLKSRGLRWSS